MSKKFKCLLFDLDGTLVSTGGAGLRALETAFFRRHGVKNCAKNISAAGKTDPVIIREIYFDTLKRDCTDEEMKNLQNDYLELLSGECERANDYNIIDGIPELLQKLDTLGFTLGLGTGNLERGAKIKLKRADLNRFFPFGGFGSDSEERHTLLKVGFEKAKQHTQLPLKPENTYIIGDTEKDILAAKKANFKVIAMGTGHMDVTTLKKYNPDFLLPNFKQQDDFLKIVS